LTCSRAAVRGDVECLKYAHENGCPWNELTSWGAAKNGHIECLKYAHENGCPWDERTCWEAAEFGQFECLKYALKEGCPSKTLGFPSDPRQMFLPVLRLVLQQYIEPPFWMKHFFKQPINFRMCLAVSDECKFRRQECCLCVPLLVETLDEVLLLSTSNNHWPRHLSVLITTFL